ncbi:amidohydrolase family protein [Acidimicrobiaceae bacterium USS-CC1]|uniref:Amidohydrolase family protein n=1 Tax=Acidiferrimicrobium australe TaxID=2664430 RepID=A0ABW9QXN0_9ACTN|nr:amidohydrolase family protein [Acidiferrimicrobium australe]
MSRGTVLDVHSHILLPGVMGACGAAGPEMGAGPDGTPFFRSGDYVLENVRFAGSPFSDVELRLERMGQLGIDEQVVSPNPLTYFYRQPAPVAVDFNRRHNDLVAEIGRSHPALHGLACLPLQDVDAACAELERAVGQLGLLGSYIGSDVAGVPLSDRRFEPLWSEHERLGVPVVVHPAPRSAEQPADRMFGPWDLEILYGFLVDEAMAVAHLLLGGVLDRHPALAVHVPHGGGFAPYQKGRLQAGLAKRPWGRELLRRPFADQWAQLSFDTAVHRDDALAFLVATEGTDRVLLGSNFAGWDQEERSVTMVEGLGLPPAGAAAVLGGNGRRLFGLAPA